MIHGKNKTPAEKLHFFKIILETQLVHHSLKIPGKFVKIYGKSLSDFASIEVPSGEIWNLKLKKENGGVWFDEGWGEFCKYYSIEKGHFLLFRYEGKSRFHSIVFDASSAEIDYPLLSKDFDDETHQLVLLEEDDDDETNQLELEEESKEEEEDDDDDDDDDDCNSIEISDPKYPKRKVKRVIESSLSHKKRKRTTFGSPGTFGKLVEKEKARVVKRDKAFMSKENPSFLIVMQPTYARGGYVNLPVDFTKNYLNERQLEVVLCGSDERIRWPVRYSWAGKETSNRRFSSGWKDFVKDNNIRVGDTCVFELTHGRDITTFKVVILRSNIDYTK